jgi:hypothetical protein
MRPKMKKMTLGKGSLFSLEQVIWVSKKCLTFMLFSKWKHTVMKNGLPHRKVMDKNIYSVAKFLLYKLFFYILEGSILSQRQVNNFE